MKVDDKLLKRSLNAAIDLSVLKKEGFKDKIRKFDESIEECLKSLDINPQFPQAYHILGHAYAAKGMYKKARQGIIKEFTGISAPFEEPEADVVVDTEKLSIEQSVNKILNSLDLF